MPLVGKPPVQAIAASQCQQVTLQAVVLGVGVEPEREFHVAHVVMAEDGVDADEAGAGGGE